MDTPYNRRVPLPPEFRRPQTKKFPFNSPAQISRSTGWLLYLALGVVVCLAAYWYHLSITTNNTNITIRRLHYSIASDVEEARTVIHHLENEVIRADTNSTTPSFTTAMNESAYALTAAASFVACHDMLIIELAKKDEPGPTCDALFERILACRYQFTKFHEHHGRVVTTCKVDIVEDLESEISRIAQRERQRAREMLREQASPFAFWNGWKSTIILRKIHRVIKNDNNYLRDRRAAALKTVLGEFSDRVKELRLISPDMESHRQTVQSLYGRVLQPFIDVRCGQPGFPCLCKGIDLEATRRSHDEVTFEISQLASR